MSVLLIKHVEMEGPGLIQDCLNEEKIPYQILNLENRARLPKPEDFKGIVILGRSMIVEKQKIENLRGSLLRRLTGTCLVPS